MLPQQAGRAAINRHLGTLKQGAEILGCHELTIRRRIADGSLTGYRIGPRMLRVDLDEVQALAQPIPAGGHNGVV